MESKLPTQTELKIAALERRALANFSMIHGSLVCMYGRPLWAVRALSEHAAEHYPRLNQFRFVDEHGKWFDIGNGREGVGVIDLVVYLAGGCPRPAATEFLERIVSDLNSTPVAAIPGRAF
jgi:hypothetical protein